MELGEKAQEITPGPLGLFGVGGVVVEAKHGEWELTLPLDNGEEATISGLCLDQITHKFPEYEIRFSNDFLCSTNSPNPKEIQFTIRETEGMFGLFA